ncbi:MAG: DUF697 domain-containing protein [Bacillota bacterium]
MKRKTFYIMIGIGLFIVFLFILASHVANVGDRLRGVHVYAEYGFYIVAILLFFVLVLNPLRIILFAPTFQIEALGDKEANRRVYKRSAKTILKSKHITEGERNRLKMALHHEEDLEVALRGVFDGSIKEDVDKIIKQYAKTALVTTAISQNGNLDMLAVIFTNFRMIKAIVERSGFRPGYVRLAKLTINVAVIAMVAEGLEDVDINEALPSRLGETVKDIPFVRSMTNSVFQGISNGMLTARIGIVTRRYLFQENQLKNPKELRLAAFKESFRLMPAIVSEGLASFPKNVMSFMTKPFTWKPFSKKGAEAE